MKGSALAAILAALVATCVANPPSNVLRFEVEEQPRVARLRDYKFSNCLPADKEAGVITSLAFKPDPLVFPGPLNVSFEVTFKQEIQAPLKGELYLGKKIGSTWIKVPCIGKIGSCTYDDICDLLSGVSECPDPFVAAGVPCNCPFEKKTYKLPNAGFSVESALFPPGDYHAQANLTMGDTVVGCYDIMATFE